MRIVLEIWNTDAFFRLTNAYRPKSFANSMCLDLISLKKFTYALLKDSSLHITILKQLNSTQVTIYETTGSWAVCTINVYKEI